MSLSRPISNLLLICFSAFLGHNLVPHHHHSEVYYNPIATDCPFEHEDHHGNEHDQDAKSVPAEHPTHCHAFNDLVFQKFSAPELHPWTGSTQALLTPCHSSLSEEGQFTSPHKYADLKLPRRNTIFPGSTGLRAPPVFA